MFHISSNIVRTVSIWNYSLCKFGLFFAIKYYFCTDKFSKISFYTPYTHEFLSRNEMFTSVMKNLSSIHNTNDIFFAENSFLEKVSSWIFQNYFSFDLLFIWLSLKESYAQFVRSYSYTKNDVELFRKLLTLFIFRS